MTAFPKPEIAIEVRHLAKSFRYWSNQPSSLKTLLVDLARFRFSMGERSQIEVLRNISFEIRQGEFVGVMGRNGVGKSTLLKLICGIYRPTSGEVRVHGAVAPLIELGAGFHGDLSGYENIFLNAAILGFGRDAVRDSLERIVEFSELGDKIHMPVKNFSSGMLVRLGFSIACHLTAPIVLVDEVLAVGDMGFQAKCLKKIHELHDEGRTIVLITHDADAVRDHCQRCIVLDHSEVVYDGEPKQGAAVYLGAVVGTQA